MGVGVCVGVGVKLMSTRDSQPTGVFMDEDWEPHYRPTSIFFTTQEYAATL